MNDEQKIELRVLKLRAGVIIGWNKYMNEIIRESLFIPVYNSSSYSSEIKYNLYEIAKR